ncbi:MAG: response regulator [Mycobacteriales bacterium]
MSGKAKILLVDDRPENLLALEAILGSLNQELVRADSGEMALKRLLTDEYAVILLDVQMPGLDGFETAAHIKRREKTKNVPIIFLTAISNEPHHAFRGYAAGAVDYLAKPFDPWVLRAKVGVFIDLYEKSKQLREQAELLRRQLSGDDATRATGLASELVMRMSAVEAQVATVDKLAAETGHDAMANALAELWHRINKLRSGLDALNPDA